jgi:hypothetical protein
MTHLRAGGKGHEGVVVGLQRGEQLTQVDRVPARPQAARGVPGGELVVRHEPGPILRRLDVDFDAVAVGVPEVVGFGQGVVGGGVGVADLDHALDEPGEVRPVRNHQSQVVEAGDTLLDRTGGAGVQHHKLAACSAEPDQRPVVHHFKAQDVAVEGQSPFPVGHGKVHCTHAGACGNRRARLGLGGRIRHRDSFSTFVQGYVLTITLQVALVFLVPGYLRIQRWTPSRLISATMR